AEVIFESVGSNGTDILSGIRLSKAQLNEGRLVVVSAAEMEEQRLPVGFGLTQNWPNPFNGSTTIRFDLMQGSEVGLTIYNLSGQRIRTLVDGFREAGSHAVRWDGKDGLGRAVASGVYLVRMEAVDFAGVKRMVMLR
ncbi:MAG: T9SS type A sorting domain-containing protein, partial [Candidatus Latescibacteria bacterium]|nr:T9SS type A sorting domain-containing protein [Candidatus Latescibacterota bacterium]